MPEKETLKRAREDKRKGKSASTQAGEFVREEIHHIRRGKHGARSPEQAIAIGLSKARRSGVKLPPPEGPSETREHAKEDLARGGKKKTSTKRARATTRALKHEGKSAASPKALASHARRSAAARKAARTRVRKAG